ncbi:MAG: YdcH family protein [Blastocatellia bacterium]|nr:YdcH family protein [Blastocatellia bacterium]
MDLSTQDPVRDALLRSDPNFRDLVHKHESYEQRLNELAGLTYPNDDEQVEESTLKKKKLMVKDEIYAMLNSYSVSH